jgi:hypothetical protein
MSIENQIAVHADEPEQLSANEVLLLLTEGHCIYIDGELCNLFDVISKIEVESLRQLAEDMLINDDVQMQIRELYIKTIQEMME